MRTDGENGLKNSKNLAKASAGLASMDEVKAGKRKNRKMHGGLQERDDTPDSAGVYGFDNIMLFY